MNIIQYLKSQKFDGSIDESKIKDDFNNKYIRVSYDRSNIGSSRRYIFTANKYKSIKKVFSEEDMKLRVEANGLVLESNGLDWEALVIPPCTPKTNNFVYNIVDTFIQNNDYTIYKLEDGTIVSLYFYKTLDKWVFSTARGIDVNYNIFNTTTYQDLFDESLGKMGIVAEDFYSSLNKSNCYTFGFKHPDMHPFREGLVRSIYKIWFVQSVSIDITTNFSKINRTSLWKQIPPHTLVRTQYKSIRMILESLKKSYVDFIKNKKMVNYGYILIANDPSKFDGNVEYTTILLESALMNYIQNLWYGIYSKYSKECTSKYTYTAILHAYLHDINFKSFKLLFPQFISEYNHIFNTEKALINSIFSNLIKLNKSNDLKKDIIRIDGNNAQEIIKVLSNSVAEKITITSHNNPKQQIQDIIHIIENFDYYFKLLNDAGDINKVPIITSGATIAENLTVTSDIESVTTSTPDIASTATSDITSVENLMNNITIS
jgi:hypothetical protein